MITNDDTSNSANNCVTCKISAGDEKPYAGGSVIELDGNWTFNQYGCEESFLGWLTLQPHRHIAHFEEFNDDESRTFGQNLKLIDTALRSYWSEHFQDDPLERLYVVCFSEYSEHFHFHLIPRTRKLGTLLKFGRQDILAWHMYKIYRYKDFPEEYVIKRNKKNENVENLMVGLQKRIQEPSKNDK